MHRSFLSSRFTGSLGTLVLLAMTAPIWAQQGSQGTVSVAVTDPSGSVIPGAKLELRDLASNDVRNALTQENGTYSFVNLSVGNYKLTVSREGFATQVYDSVVVQAARVTDVAAKLQVGAT